MLFWKTTVIVPVNYQSLLPLMKSKHFSLVKKALFGTASVVLVSTGAFSQAVPVPSPTGEQAIQFQQNAQAAQSQFQGNVQALQNQMQSGAAMRQANAQQFQADAQAASAEIQNVASQFQGSASEVAGVIEENMEGISEDLLSIQAGSEVTPEQIDAVKMSTQAVLTDIDNEPSSEAVAAMAFQVQRATMDGMITPMEMDAIQASMGEVMISAGVSEESVEAMNASVDALVEASGVDQEDVEVIVGGLKDLVTDLGDFIPE